MTIEEVVKEMHKDSCYICKHYRADFFDNVGTCRFNNDELIRQPARMCDEYEKYDVENEFDF